MTPRCHTCDSPHTEHQLCGFWFCFYCLPAALAKGASYWTRLYALLYPWR